MRVRKGPSPEAVRRIDGGVGDAAHGGRESASWRLSAPCCSPGRPWPRSPDGATPAASAAWNHEFATSGTVPVVPHDRGVAPQLQLRLAAIKLQPFSARRTLEKRRYAGRAYYQPVLPISVSVVFVGQISFLT